MKEKHSFNFLIGLLIGGLVGLLFWYWQKSTSAEDGALALLDKLAHTEKRVRQLKSELADSELRPPVLQHLALPKTAADLPSFLSRNQPEVVDDLTQVKGIGAVFNDRLQAAGIQSFAGLQKLTAQQLADILQIRPGRAENILAAAQNQA